MKSEEPEMLPVGMMLSGAIEIGVLLARWMQRQNAGAPLTMEQQRLIWRQMDDYVRPVIEDWESAQAEQGLEIGSGVVPPQHRVASPDPLPNPMQLRQEQEAPAAAAPPPPVAEPSSAAEPAAGLSVPPPGVTSEEWQRIEKLQAEARAALEAKQAKTGA